MCSDGAWLNGLSKLVSAANRNAGKPWVSGCVKRELERKQDEADDRHDLRREQAAAMGIELRPRCADEQRQTIEGVDRPIRNDRPAEKRNAAFPREHDGGDIVPMRREAFAAP